MQFSFKISTKEKNEIVDITKQIESIVTKSKVKDGLCNVYTSHATCSIIINENYDPNVCKDIIKFLSSLIPEGKWLHDKIDNNGAAHIKAAILGPSKIIPIKNNRLQLGQWQNCMFCDFDGPREREIIVTIQKTL